MAAFILIHGEGPSLANEIAPRLEPQGNEKVLCRLAFNANDSTLTSWVAYAARRRLRRKRLGSRWPAEVVS